MSVRGTDKLCRQLNDSAKAMQDSLVKGISNATKMVQANAKMLAPTETGNLKNRIFAKTEKIGTGARGVVYTNEEYGPCCFSFLDIDVTELDVKAKSMNG